MAVALIALFVAMGGTGYAALKLPKSSVGTKQLKKNAVRSAKIKNGTVARGDLSAKARRSLRGQRGVRGRAGAPCLPSNAACRGPAGAPATRLWAAVDADPTAETITRSSGATALSRFSDGIGPLGGYEVEFNRDVSACSVSVTPEDDPDPDVSWFAETSSDGPALSPREVFVRFENSTGSLVDVDFYVQVFC